MPFYLPVVHICQELGDRREQQDRFVVNQHELGLLVAIADGHGGDKVANIVASQLTFIFNTQLGAALKKINKTTQSLLTGRFLRAVLEKTVQQLVNVCQHQQSGSTLSIALIEQGYQHGESYQRGSRVTTAQLGDSIIAMSRKKGHLLMPRLHCNTALNPDIQKIRSLHKQGTKFNLPIAITRALGDCDIILLTEPELKTYFLPLNSLLLMASDGVLTQQGCSARKQLNKVMSWYHQGFGNQEVMRKLAWLHDKTTLIFIAL